MTHSIISLGQRAAPSALLLRASWQAQICESLPISSSGFFSWPKWPTDSVTVRIRLSSWQPDFQRLWGVTGRIKCSFWSPDFYGVGGDVLQIKPELSKWKLRWLCHGCNQVIILITWFWYSYNQVPKVGTWFGGSCKSSYGKRNLISDDSPNSHFGDLGVSD